jgi:adenylosuccinate lyase
MSDTRPDTLFALNALSPLDGRYASKTEALRDWLSEAAFMRNRVTVEIHWLIALSRAGFAEVPRFSEASEQFLLQLAERFTAHDAARIKEIERVTNHDVKAVEYWLKESVKGQEELERASEFIHFACTSEDINNTSHGLMLAGAREHVILPALRSVHQRLVALAHAHAEQPMLSRTHGQPASPTTLGKEIANVAARLESGVRLGSVLARSGRTAPEAHLQSVHDPDRAARLHGRTVRRRVARQHDPAGSGPRCVGLHLGRLLQAAHQGG